MTPDAIGKPSKTNPTEPTNSNEVETIVASLETSFQTRLPGKPSQVPPLPTADPRVSATYNRQLRCCPASNEWPTHMSYISKDRFSTSDEAGGLTTVDARAHDAYRARQSRSEPRDPINPIRSRWHLAQFPMIRSGAA